MSIGRKLLFIVVFAPALLFMPLGFIVTACRLSWAGGREAAVKLLAEMLAHKGVKK